MSESLGANVIATGKDLGIPEYGWVVALATAMQESTLRNVGHGDQAGPDARGLFQQRRGKRSRTPASADRARFFYTGGSTAPDGYAEPGLTDIPRWQELGVGAAAQAVQRSADPSGAWYARWEPLARDLIRRYAGGSNGGGTGGDMCGSGSALNCPPTPWPQLEEGLTPDAQRVLRYLHQQFPDLKTFHGIGERPEGGAGDHAAGRAIDAMVPDWDKLAGNQRGWQIAEWVKANARGLGVHYVIFDVKIWSVEHTTEGWRPYTHYKSCSTNTCLHRDHVSVYGNAAANPGPVGPWTLPIRKGDYTLTARFGQCGGSWANCHTGLDFAAGIGIPIHAAAAGTVAAISHNGAYGNLTNIDHPAGSAPTTPTSPRSPSR